MQAAIRRHHLTRYQPGSHYPSDRLASAAGVVGGLLAVLGADLAFTILCNCQKERRAAHPCAHWWLRPLAAAEAFVAATLFSETGRLAGHLKRRQLETAVAQPAPLL